eukprot:1040547-Pyramimonas_sp.AAC.1
MGPPWTSVCPMLFWDARIPCGWVYFACFIVSRTLGYGSVACPSVVAAAPNTLVSLVFWVAATNHKGNQFPKLASLVFW